ncbi:hypothetical protein GCK32_009877 [Trichostrongylus colubriformis]|uniref:Uncharacterized protein n=1 Tax=Trichostrongylus colubriformis TaxID=6319 RepID=A0AAN8ILC4_TRICO
MNTADPKPTKNNCSTGDEMTFHVSTDDTVSAAPLPSSESSRWPTADEKVNEENDKDNWSVAEVQEKDLLRNNSGMVSTDGAHIIPFITVERQGQKVQFAAKRPRQNSICSILSATTAAAGTTIEDAVTLRERVPSNTNGGENAGAEVSLLNEEVNSQLTGTPSKKSDTSSESTPVCRPSKAKQKRIYIVTRWTPEGTPVKEGADDRASSPFTNESTVMKEPSPKRSKFAESEMESTSMRVTQCVKAVPARHDVVEVTQIVRSASTGNASDLDSTTSARPENQSELLARSPSHDSNSTTSTGLVEQEICQSTVRSQSPVSADSDNEKVDSEVTPRITRSRSRAAAMDSARNETTSSPITTRSRTLAQQGSETPTVLFRRSVRFRRVRMKTQLDKPSSDNNVDEKNSAQYAPAKWLAKF